MAKEETIKYYTVSPEQREDDVLKHLSSTYGLNNLFVHESPQKMMGSQKILPVKITGRNITLKIEGPGNIIERIYERLTSKKKEI
jgi:hypothetical protein